MKPFEIKVLCLYNKALMKPTVSLDSPNKICIVSFIRGDLGT